jgi:hypothetical protein
MTVLSMSKQEFSRLDVLLRAPVSRLRPLTPSPVPSDWLTCRFAKRVSQARGECHLYFAHAVSFLTCADIDQSVRNTTFCRPQMGAGLVCCHSWAALVLTSSSPV